MFHPKVWLWQNKKKHFEFNFGWASSRSWNVSINQRVFATNGAFSGLGKRCLETLLATFEKINNCFLWKKHKKIAIRNSRNLSGIDWGFGKTKKNFFFFPQKVVFSSILGAKNSSVFLHFSFFFEVGTNFIFLFVYFLPRIRKFLGKQLVGLGTYM